MVFFSQTISSFYASLALMKCRKFRLEETVRGVECTRVWVHFPPLVFSSRASYSLIGNTTGKCARFFCVCGEMKGMRSSVDKNDALRWNEILEHDARLASVEEVRIRTLAELESPEKCIIRNMYFDEVRLFRCYAGYFTFELEDGCTIILREGEALVIYPGHRLTIAEVAERTGFLSVSHFSTFIKKRI